MSLKRSGWPRPAYVRPPQRLNSIERASKPWAQGPIEPVEKDNACRSEAYRRAVAALACAHCGNPPPNQCAHVDLGKGQGYRTDDRQTFAACADRPGREGCHSLIGRRLAREHRRMLEARYAERTRSLILAAGNWPPSVPAWKEGTP